MRTALTTVLSIAAATTMFASATRAERMESVRKFVEDNNLWMQDDINSGRGATEEQFNRIIDLGLEAYKPMAEANDETLNVNRKWDDSTVNASCGRFWGSVTVNMYGGLARREEVTPEGFALVLCHELGHAYGGAPLISTWNNMSAEGQSDWYGAKECLRKVLPNLEENDQSYANVTPYVEEKCAGIAEVDSVDYKVCLRSMSAGVSLGKLLATLKKVDVPQFDTPDLTIAEETMLSYPKTIQCRFDSYIAGALNLDRPACWYKAEE